MIHSSGHWRLRALKPCLARVRVGSMTFWPIRRTGTHLLSWAPDSKYFRCFKYFGPFMGQMISVQIFSYHCGIKTVIDKNILNCEVFFDKTLFTKTESRLDLAHGLPLPTWRLKHHFSWGLVQGRVHGAVRSMETQF